MINEVRKESVMYKYMLIYTSNILFSYAIGYGYISNQINPPPPPQTTTTTQNMCTCETLFQIYFKILDELYNLSVKHCVI